MIHSNKKRISALLLAAAIAAASAPAAAFAGPASEIGIVNQTTDGIAETDVDFDVRAFSLPSTAGVLVVVEGTEGSACDVYAYKKVNNTWERVFKTDAYLGKNGISYDRHVGDKTTPAGLFRMNTPFGQKDALEGFPAEYFKANENHVWTDSTNRVTTDPTHRIPGEYIGTNSYEVVYNYAIDMGFNRNGLYNKGSALFLHCKAYNAYGSSGCVAVPEARMIEILKLVGTYGTSNSYIAIAPRGHFDTVYNALGVNQGLSPVVNIGGPAR